MENEIILPNGDFLQAKLDSEGDYPSISVYWKHRNKDDLLCFAEYNPEHNEGHQICVGAYCESEDDVVYYDSYRKEQR